jgi:hypothetical protein
MPTRTLTFWVPRARRKCKTACQAAIDEYFACLTTGSVDPVVTIPKLLAKLKDSGNDKFTAEM